MGSIRNHPLFNRWNPLFLSLLETHRQGARSIGMPLKPGKIRVQSTGTCEVTTSDSSKRLKTAMTIPPYGSDSSASKRFQDFNWDLPFLWKIQKLWVSVFFVSLWIISNSRFWLKCTAFKMINSAFKASIGHQRGHHPGCSLQCC